VLVVESTGRFDQVVHADALASSLGLRAGLKLSAALALANQLTVHRRQPAAEAALLASLAAWAQQFTPTVALAPPATLLLEVGGCLRYFGGLSSLLEQVRAGLAELGHAVRMGCAPTPLAAQWAAWLGLPPVMTAGDLPAVLAAMSIRVLQPDRKQADGLSQLGINTLAQLQRLPRGGLNKRFGPALLLQLDRALGKVADPREPFVAPDRFERCIDLDYPFEQLDVFLLLADRLLAELAAFLSGRGLGVQAVLLRCKHEGLPASVLPVGFGVPLRRAAEMQAVLAERAARFSLPAPVLAVTLLADVLHPLDGQPLSLFGPGGDADGGDASLLLARLAARLGDDAVCGLVAVDEHRPELAWQAVQPGAAGTAQARGERPGWLLPQPLPLSIRDEQPWYGEALACIGQPERIESGWWDGEAVVRDYFQARGASGRRYWIYRDRVSHGWYLHGMFG
jgi:protein ImuB